jgi:hypothetical protein
VSIGTLEHNAPRERNGWLNGFLRIQQAVTVERRCKTRGLRFSSVSAALISLCLPLGGRICGFVKVEEELLRIARQYLRPSCNKLHRSSGFSS